MEYCNGRLFKLNELSGSFLNAGLAQAFYRNRQEVPASLVSSSIRYKSETIELSTWKTQHGQKKYLRDQTEEAFNQILFFNLSVLIISKVTCGWAHIWNDSRFSICCYAKYKLYCSEFVKIFRTNKKFKTFLP